MQDDRSSSNSIEYWDDANRDRRTGRFPPAWRAEEHATLSPGHPLEENSTPTLLELANAVVQFGDRIEHKEIPDLRALIEAVQAHPDAQLAAQSTTHDRHAESRRYEIAFDHEPDDRVESPSVAPAPPSTGSGEPSETILAIIGGEVLECDCRDIEIRCKLRAITRFARPARFDRATFAVNTDFFHRNSGHSALFADTASFESCMFKGKTSFELARFMSSATFDFAYMGDKFECENVQFNDQVTFRSATFRNEAPFWGATFRAKADFTGVHFDAYMKFPSAQFFDYVTFAGARFLDNANFTRAHFHSDVNLCGEGKHHGALVGGMLDFSHAIIERRLIFFDDVRDEETQFGAAGRLRLCKLVCMSGAAIELSPRQINLASSRDEVLDRMHLDWTWTESLPRWLQLALAILRESLGIGHCGKLVLGEDSNELDELEMAESDYNRLRDLFRSQPSTDVQEEICNFKYLDLSRRTRFTSAKQTFDESPKDWPDHVRYVWECSVRAFDWTVRRNALGYLIESQRILVTGALVMLLYAILYWLGGDTAFDDVTAAEGSTGMSLGNALYFSVVTFTSLGYGDIHPLGFFKVFAASEALVGVALISLFIVAWARKMVQ